MLIVPATRRRRVAALATVGALAVAALGSSGVALADAATPLDTGFTITGNTSRIFTLPTGATSFIATLTGADAASGRGGAGWSQTVLATPHDANDPSFRASTGNAGSGSTGGAGNFAGGNGGSSSAGGGGAGSVLEVGGPTDNRLWTNVSANGDSYAHYSSGLWSLALESGGGGGDGASTTYSQFHPSGDGSSSQTSGTLTGGRGGGGSCGAQNGAGLSGDDDVTLTGGAAGGSSTNNGAAGQDGKGAGGGAGGGQLSEQATDVTTGGGGGSTNDTGVGVGSGGGGDTGDLLGLDGHSSTAENQGPGPDAVISYQGVGTGTSLTLCPNRSQGRNGSITIQYLYGVDISVTAPSTPVVAGASATYRVEATDSTTGASIGTSNWMAYPGSCTDAPIRGSNAIGGVSVPGETDFTYPGHALDVTVPAAASLCFLPTLSGSDDGTLGTSWAGVSYLDPINSTAQVTTSIAVAPSITTSTLAPATIGDAYSATVAASGTPHPTFAVTDGALPDGLALDATTGAISGTPTEAGHFSATVRASNSVGDDDADLTLVVQSPPAITSDAPGDGVLGVPYDATVTASGVEQPTFAVTDGALPDGLALDRASGRISGTPSAGGDFAFTVTASNALGGASAEYTIEIATVPEFTSTDLPDGTRDAAYSATLTASGLPAATFSIATGALPDGLTLDAATGVISGTPTAAGTFPLTVTATNRAGAASADTQLVIAPVAATAPLDLSAVPSDGAVRLTWTAPVDDGGSPVASYAVESSVGGGDWRPAATTAATAMGVTLHGLTNGAAYRFRVTATTAAGSGAASASVAKMPFVFAPTLKNGGHAVTVTTDLVSGRTSITIAASALPPGSVLHATLHSAPIDLGAATVDAAGDVTLTALLPAGVTGAHHVIATLAGTGAATDPSVSFAVTIAAADSGSDGSSGGAGSGSTGSLAYTGMATGALPVALVLALLGAALIVVPRRRRVR